MEFEGKVALVTGGASGIGLATAELLAARGAQVVSADIAHVSSSRTASATVEHVRLDVTDEEAVISVIEAAVSRHGRLDILVSAAGVQCYGEVVDTAVSEWQRVMTVNVTGAFLTAKHALPVLRASRAGSMVVVSSVQAFVTQRAVAAYTASKGALNALVRAIAIDEAANGVRANTVCPASVDTPLLRAAARRFSDSDEAAHRLIVNWGRSHPLGRVARAGEVAEAIAFLASDRASFITGVALPVDGGLLAQAAVVLPE